MNGIVASRMFALAFDCTDATVAGAFWAQATGQQLDPGADKKFASIGLHDAGRHAPRWCFVQVPGIEWARSRRHPDLITADLATEVARLIDLGASRKEVVESDGTRWATLLDPEGNEFDVIAVAA